MTAFLNDWDGHQTLFRGSRNKFGPARESLTVHMDLIYASLQLWTQVIFSSPFPLRSLSASYIVFSVKNMELPANCR